MNTKKLKKIKAVTCAFTAHPDLIAEWKREAESMYIDLSTFIRLACGDFIQNNRFKKAITQSPDMLKEVKEMIARAEKEQKKKL